MTSQNEAALISESQHEWEINELTLEFLNFAFLSIGLAYPVDSYRPPMAVSNMG